MKDPFAIIECDEDWIKGTLHLYDNGETSCVSAYWYAEGGKLVVSNGEHTLTLDAPSDYSAGSRHAVEQMQARHRQIVQRRKSIKDRIQEKKERQLAKQSRSVRVPLIPIELPCKYRGTQRTQLGCGGCPGGKPSLYPCGHPEVEFDRCLVDGYDRAIRAAQEQGFAVCAFCKVRDDGNTEGTNRETKERAT